MAQSENQNQHAPQDPEVAATKKSGAFSRFVARATSIGGYIVAAAATTGAAVIGFGGKRILGNDSEIQKTNDFIAKTNRRTNWNIKSVNPTQFKRIAGTIGWVAAALAATTAAVVGIWSHAHGKVASDAKALRDVQDGNKTLEETQPKSGKFSRFLTKTAAVTAGTVSTLAAVTTVISAAQRNGMGAVWRAGVAVTGTLATLGLWKAANRADELKTAKNTKEARVAYINAAAEQKAQGTGI